MEIAFVVLICLLSLSVIYGYNALLVNAFEESPEIVVFRGNTLSINSKKSIHPLGDPIQNPYPH